MARGAHPDNRPDPERDLALAAQNARRWWTGVGWATGVGYGSAWLVGRFSGLGSVVLAIAIVTQLVCFIVGWHYLNKMDRATDQLLATTGMSRDIRPEKGWTGFAKRHPTLFAGVAGVVGVGALVVVAFRVHP